MPWKMSRILYMSKEGHPWPVIRGWEIRKPVRRQGVRVGGLEDWLESCDEWGCEWLSHLCPASSCLSQSHFLSLLSLDYTLGTSLNTLPMPFQAFLPKHVPCRLPQVFPHLVSFLCLGPLDLHEAPAPYPWADCSAHLSVPLMCPLG